MVVILLPAVARSQESPNPFLGSVPRGTAVEQSLTLSLNDAATSLFNLMRNLGGSIGIAMTGTLLARKQQMFTNILGARVDPYSPTAQAAIESARRTFVAGGSDPTSAAHRAYAMLFGTVQHHASMAAFIDLFRLLGILFLLLLPLVLLMRRPRGHSAVAAH